MPRCDWLPGQEYASGSLRVGWGGVPESHQGKQAEFTRPMQIQIWPCCGEGSTLARWHPPIGCTRGGFNAGIMAAFPPTLTLKPHNSVFSYMSLVPLELLSLCLRVSLYIGPLKGYLGFQPSVSPEQTESPLIFTARFGGDFFSWHSNSGLGSPSVGLWLFATPGGPLQPISHLFPFFQPQCRLFFISLVTVVMFS